MRTHGVTVRTCTVDVGEGTLISAPVSLEGHPQDGSETHRWLGADGSAATSAALSACVLTGPRLNSNTDPGHAAVLAALLWVREGARGSLIDCVVTNSPKFGYWVDGKGRRTYMHTKHSAVAGGQCCVTQRVATQSTRPHAYCRYCLGVFDHVRALFFHVETELS